MSDYEWHVNVDIWDDSDAPREETRYDYMRSEGRVMGIDVIESKIRTARKTHHCDYCGEIIKKGEEYDYQKNIFDGTFYEWHTHLACSRVASAIWDYVDPDDGMSDQNFQDGCQEVCQRFVCPDCPKWNKEYSDCDEDLTYCIDKMDDFFKTHELYKAGRKAYYEIWKCRKKAMVE